MIFRIFWHNNGHQPEQGANKKISTHQCWWYHKLKMRDRKSMLFLFCLQAYLDKHKIRGYQMLSGHQRLDNLNYLSLMKINSNLDMDTYYILKRNWNWCCCQATCSLHEKHAFSMILLYTLKKKIRREEEGC